MESLEQTLTQMVREFDIEREILERQIESELKISKEEISRLQRQLELRNKEMNHVKLLAKNLLSQRSSVESFFLDALEHVKKEIAHNRAQYRKHALIAYQKSVAAAERGEQDFPKVRTFRLLDRSTNSVYKDLAQAENWSHLMERVDVGDLTWEQKEQVLRLLFAKMNSASKESRHDKRSQCSLVPLQPRDDESTRLETAGDKGQEDIEPTFLTQREHTTEQGPVSVL